MLHRLFRITPNKEFTLNNRWPGVIVQPKGYFFFITRDKEDLWKWVYFLCETKEKTHLWIHYVLVDIINRKDRMLTEYKKLEIWEVTAPVSTTRILLHDKRVKVTLGEARKFIRELKARRVDPIPEKERRRTLKWRSKR